MQKCALHWRQWAARRRSLNNPKGVGHMIKPVSGAFNRPVRSPDSMPIRQIIVNPIEPSKPSKGLVPMLSASPARSKGLVPEPVPSKHVEFKLNR